MSIVVRRNFDSPVLRDDFFGPVQQLFNEFFDDFFKKENLVKIQNSKFPKMDIGTDGKKFFIKAAVSGFTKDDITIEITPENILRISGKKEEKTDPDVKYWVKQVCQRQFVKEIQLPDNLDATTAPNVTLADGMLVMTWHTARVFDEKPKTRIIQINSE